MHSSPRRRGCLHDGKLLRAQELRQALVTDGAATLAGGAAWDAAAEACAGGAPGAGLERLLQLWADLRQVPPRLLGALPGCCIPARVLASRHAMQSLQQVAADRGWCMCHSLSRSSCGRSGTGRRRACAGRCCRQAACELRAFATVLLGAPRCHAPAYVLGSGMAVGVYPSVRQVKGWGHC